MALALVQVVLLGIAAAVAPLPVILAIALLETSRPVANSVAYLLGGLLVYVTLALVGGTVVIKIDEGLGLRRHASTGAYALVTAIGVVFLVIAIFTWRSTHPVRIPPRVNQMLASMGTLRAFVLGLLLCSPGLKNIALMAAALGTISAQQPTIAYTVLAMSLFLLIALAPPTAPLVTYLVLPDDQARALTAGWRTWIDDHARSLLMVVSAAIGVIMLLEGLSGLFG